MTAPALVSVVAPFHNEGAGVDAFVARTVAVLDGLGAPWELIGVDDGSTADTRERLRDESGRLREHLNVFHNEEEIRRLQGEATPLRDGDTVHVMPAVSGGRK